MTAAGMAAAAWLISLGMYAEDGFYSRPGLVLVSLAIVVCASTMWGQKARAAAPPPRLADAALAAALVVEARLLVVSAHAPPDRKSTRLNSSHQIISYAVFCLK